MSEETGHPKFEWSSLLNLEPLNAETESGPDASLVSVDVGGVPRRQGERLSADDIYFTDEYGSRVVAATVRLVRDAIADADTMIEALNRGEAIEADDALNHLRAGLAEAHRSCSGLGDGFGILVSSTLWSIHNLAADPATVRQAMAIRKVLRSAVAEPFMSAERAAELTLSIEEAGLNPIAPGVAAFLSWLDDDDAAASSESDREQGLR